MCCKPSVLKKSHAIPNAFFKKILREDSGKGIAISARKSTPVHSTIDSWSTYQLCLSCEKYLNDNYERYSINWIRGKKGEVSVIEKAGIKFKNIETNILLGFFTSIFWRASNSTHDAYTNVKMPPNLNNDIRFLLFNNQSISSSVVTVKLSRLIDSTIEGAFTSTELKQIVISPFRRELGYNKCSFCFIFEGFLIEIFTPSLKFGQRNKPGVLIKNRDELFVPFIEVFDIPEVKQLLVEGYRKYEEGEVTI